MSPNKRIFLNIIATYGRSLFALLCGVFTSRWVLEALGAESFGLYGVVGGTTVFITLLNTMLACATGRYYAFAVGAAQRMDVQSGLEECRKWFNTSLMIHSVLPCLLLCIGYPIGIYAVKHWLTIPPEKLVDCIWIFRFVCVSTFISMLNVPFYAMYTAKQYIAELTMYTFLQTVLNAGFVLYMATHPGDWLRGYAFGMMIIAILPQLLICLRAVMVFPECRFCPSYTWDWGRIRQLGNFAFWQTFGCLGSLMRGQGIQILINKQFGPTVNASMTIANSVSGHTQTLVAALHGAFAPAITTACGAGDYDLMRRLAFRTCKFGMLLGLIFILPLLIELESVLKLWLVNPPPYAAELCGIIILAAVIDKSTSGQMLAVGAKGRIAEYQAFLGSALIMTLPIAWGFVKLGGGVKAVGWAIVLGMLLCGFGRVCFARSLAGMSARYWALRIILPCAVNVLIAATTGWFVRRLMEPCILRILVVSAVTDLVLFTLAWFLCLDAEERSFVLEKVNHIWRKR